MPLIKLYSPYLPNPWKQEQYCMIKRYAGTGAFYAQHGLLGEDDRCTNADPSRNLQN
jgi:hypothetical protein